MATINRMKIAELIRAILEVTSIIPHWISWTSYEDLEAVGKKCIAMKIVATNV
jgi:hypothetical protein